MMRDSAAERDDLKRKCHGCMLYKPDRAHHCAVCGVCVLRMDHHCPWVASKIQISTEDASLEVIMAYVWLILLLPLSLSLSLSLSRLHWFSQLQILPSDSVLRRAGCQYSRCLHGAAILQCIQAHLGCQLFPAT
jgi:hypothetical protein